MASVKLSDRFRDRLNDDVSSTLSALCSYMELYPFIEEMVFLYHSTESGNKFRNGFMVQFTQYSILSFCLGLEGKFQIHQIFGNISYFPQFNLSFEKKYLFLKMPKNHPKIYTKPPNSG